MTAKSLFIFVLVMLAALVVHCNRHSLVEELTDLKVFKQLLRTRTNVMVLFTAGGGAEVDKIYRAFKEAAQEVRGIGTMVRVQCSGQGAKLCRSLKAAPEPYVMFHFKDGKFHKVYDRQDSAKSMVRFMKDPTGDLPWEEDPAGKSVVHLDSPQSLEKLLKKHKRVLVMFYAPWCKYCKLMKPEYAAASSKVRADGLGILAAMDVVRAENAIMRTKYNISGFPTVHYFKNGEILATYEGENKEEKIVEFMKDPKAAPAKPPQEPHWSEEKSEVHHLSADGFDHFLKNHPETLVMFYAPWCGHCKKLKPEWTKAANLAQANNVAAVLAAVDATRDPSLAERFKIKGYPTIKFFKDGEFAFDTPMLRDAQKILEFLEDPKEPPPAPPPDPNWADEPSEVVHLTEETFKTQLRSKRHALVIFYAPWCGHCKAAKPQFTQAAEQLREEPRIMLGAVNCVDHPALCKLYHVKGYPTFKYFKYYKETSDYNGGRKAEDFVKFLTSLEPDAQVAAAAPDSPPSGKVIDTREDLMAQISDEDKAVLEKLKKEQENDFPGWEKLVHLTDANYKAKLATHRDVLIMFHANWCIACKKVKPAFAEVAQDYDHSLGVMAAVDATTSPNLVDEFHIESLPVFKYVREGKAFMDYSGETTTKGFRDFLEKMKTLKDEL